MKTGSSTSRSETLRLTEQDASRAGELLRAGKLVVFPTETVYGLGADATSETATRAIFQAKGRPQDNPLIVHLASVGQLLDAIPAELEAARLLARRFCPGPLTLVVPAPPWVSPVVRAGLPTVGLRVPAHPVAAAVLQAAGRPVAAPSANRSGRPSPTVFSMACAEMDGRVAAIVDGGPSAIGLESTVVDARRPDAVRILRPGVLDAVALGRVVRVVKDDVTVDGPADAATPPRSPGTRYPHYRPAVPVRVLERAELREAVAALRGTAAAGGHGWGAGQPAGWNPWMVLGPDTGDADAGDPPVFVMSSWDEYGRELYRLLWEAERAGASEILLEFPPDRPDCAALRDRLGRAAGYP